MVELRERKKYTQDTGVLQSIKDDTLNEIVLHPPKHQDDLGRIRGLSAGWKSNDIGARLIAALEAAKPLEQSELPDREPKRPGLTKDGALVSDLLKLLLKIRAKETGVAARLIATTEHANSSSQAVMRRLGMRILENPHPEPAWLQTVGILDRPG